MEEDLIGEALPRGWRVLEEGGDGDPFHHRNGPFYIADPFEPTAEEAVRLGFRVEKKHCNFAATAHGGWISTILDVSMGKNIHQGLNAYHTPTISLTVDFMRAGKIGDWLESRARIIRATRSIVFSDCLLIGPEGPVARANGVFKIVTQRA